MIKQNIDFKTAELSGSIGALIGEYRKAIDELITVIKPINKQQLCEIIDHTTTDDDCKSIQTILTHVVCSGFGYIIYIENYLGNNKPRLERIPYENVSRYIEQLDGMFEYALNFFLLNPIVEIEQIDQSKKIIVNWGQQYDIEQLLEHAIVHILRHRRQIEKFILKFST